MVRYSSPKFLSSLVKWTQNKRFQAISSCFTLRPQLAVFYTFSLYKNCHNSYLRNRWCNEVDFILMLSAIKTFLLKIFVFTRKSPNSKVQLMGNVWECEYVMVMISICLRVCVLTDIPVVLNDRWKRKWN